VEIRRRDPDNLEGMSLQRQLAPDRVGVAPELPLPERVADHRARRAAASLHVVGRGEHAAHKRRHTQHLEEFAAYPYPPCVPRWAAGVQVPHGGAPGKHTAETFLLLLDLLPHRIRQLRVAAPEVAA